MMSSQFRTLVDVVPDITGLRIRRYTYTPERDGYPYTEPTPAFWLTITSGDDDAEDRTEWRADSLDEYRNLLAALTDIVAALDADERPDAEVWTTYPKSAAD